MSRPVAGVVSHGLSVGDQRIADLRAYLLDLGGTHRLVTAVTGSTE
jgi:hypothetical protein